MAIKILLKEDVDSLGRKGDIVSVKSPGFVRNYLLPQGKGWVADPNTIRMQKRLKEERDKQAVKDRSDAESLRDRLKEVVLTTTVKVDHEGHMYGSVAEADVVELLNAQSGIRLIKKSVVMKRHIKALGLHTIDLKLNEGVMASVQLNILEEGK